MLRKNVAGQFLYFSGVNATTGAALTGATFSVRRAIDGTFAAGGATITEDTGLGFYKAALTQADTNGNDLAFFFTATNAIPVCINALTTATDPSTDTTQTGDSYARLGAPAGASVSADVAAVKVDTAAILVDTGTTLDARIPAALVSGRMDVSVGAMAANVLTATAINADAITAAKVAADVTTEIQTGLATAANLAIVAGYLDTEIAAIKAVTDALPNAGALTTIQADLDDIQTRIPAALSSGNMKVDVLALNGDATSAANIAKTTRAIARITASGTPTTTSIPTSAITPAVTVADQLKGRILTWDADTTTAALRGQATDITANTSGGVLTVTALTTAPASGDTGSVT